MRAGAITFSLLLYGILKTLRHKARRHPHFARRLAERDFTAQIRTFDGAVARYYAFRAGSIESSRGLHPRRTSRSRSPPPPSGRGSSRRGSTSSSASRR